MLCFVSLVGSKVGAEWPIQDEEEETGSQEFESFFFPCAVAAVRPASCCCSDDATGAIQTTVLWRWRAPSDHGGCHANWRLATETAGRSKLRVVLCRQTHHMRSSARRPPVARQRRPQLRCRGARGCSARAGRRAAFAFGRTRQRQLSLARTIQLLRAASYWYRARTFFLACPAASNS